MQSGNWIPVFAVLGIAGPFFWLGPSPRALGLNECIMLLGGGFWVWVVVRPDGFFRALAADTLGPKSARPLLRRRWMNREPLKSHIMRWWEGSSPDARVYFFAFVLAISTAVWQHRTGDQVQISDFGAGEVEWYTWRYWGITEKWTEVQFDQDLGVWLAKGTGLPFFCHDPGCLGW